LPPSTPAARAPAGPVPAGRLLGPDDPAPFELHRPDARAPVVVACDHASRAFPAALGRLGLPREATWRHIAFDIGAGELARALADRLDALAVLAGYSRLVIDCNRRLDDPTAIVAVSDGQRIPGNEHLSAEERDARAEACYWPYHAALDAALGARTAGARVPVLLAVHSFTPVYAARARPWQVGVLWDRDPRIAGPLIARLAAEKGLVVGDNEPYSGRHPADYTIDRHAEAAGLPHVCLEVRQDELLTPTGVARWAERLAAALGPILADPGLYVRRADGPVTGAPR
jgi:predicted N-formylglutamate amidohydrolase